nr:hypothetical protein [Tanacetum cinerariifolium]
EEDEENKDAEIEEAGVEPEAEGADVELEAEEPDGASEATIGTGSQRPFAIRGLAPWALRRDLEALRRHERIREAESETSRTEIALIMPPKPMSEARMREIIRDQFATSMNEFMANMNSRAGGPGGASGSGGAGGSGGTGRNADGTGVRDTEQTVPELTGCTYATFIKCDPLPFNGTEGAVGMDIDGYTNRFHELALLCPRMVEPEAVKVEQYIRGLAKSIRGDVTSSQPATINDAVRLAYQLAGQLI